MTGFGAAQDRGDTLSVQIEIRTVNNRYLKINTKLPETYGALDSEIERVVREKVTRGSVSVTIRVEHLQAASATPLNELLLDRVVTQLRNYASRQGLEFQPQLTELVNLPGIVADDSSRHGDPEQDWPFIRQVLQSAVERLHQFRSDEGRAMENELSGLGQVITDRLGQVTELAPQVSTEYRAKLLDRIRQVLAQTDVTVTESDLIREVAVYADRTDITEEITRLKFHLEQYETFLRDPISAGRKLDFLSQEMNREVNTIGSKANNVPIAHCVVEMKGAVEKIREILQNVE